MVREMKAGFSTALEALVQIQMGDQVLQERVNNNKIEHDSQLADVLNMVLSLKVRIRMKRAFTGRLIDVVLLECACTDT